MGKKIRGTVRGVNRKQALLIEKAGRMYDERIRDLQKQLAEKESKNFALMAYAEELELNLIQAQGAVEMFDAKFEKRKPSFMATVEEISRRSKLRRNVMTTDTCR